ncbi:MAG TPA: RNA methyltransferase [Bacilli bacterium]
MATEILSIHNNRVKQWAQLLEKKGRDQQGKFLLEGIHLIMEAIQAHTEIDCIVYSIDRGIPLELHRISDLSVEWIGVTEAILAKCTDTITPQGVFAIVNKLAWNAQTILNHHHSLVVVIDGVQDPGNLGTIIRSADATQASGVLIGKGSVDLYNPKTIRSTMGSLFHLPVAECNLEEILPLAGSKSIQLVNTNVQAEQHCYQLDLTKDTWFIVGNEGHGVSKQVAEFIGKHIKIPIHGEAESLNVAMATTVLLYEALRQRHYNF